MLSSNIPTLVRTEFIGSTGIIYLSDPTRLNALTVAMGSQFVNAVEEMRLASEDQKIRACIITGDGNIIHYTLYNIQYTLYRIIFTLYIVL